MPENEEIDLSKAPRWQAVLEAVRCGDPIELVAQKVRDSLFKTLRSLIRMIPFDQFIRAIDGDPASLSVLGSACGKGRDYADLLVQVAAEGGGRKVVLENFVTDICHAFFDQIVHEVVPSGGWSNVSDVPRVRI